MQEELEEEKLDKWYIVFDFGYSDTDTCILEYYGEPSKSEVACELGMEERKIRHIEKLED